MKHFTSPGFWDAFNQLPMAAQRVARKNYELLKADPRHRSLHFKRVGPYWSVRVGRTHRALGIDVEGGILWSWIGTHSEYERMIQ